MKPIKLKTLNKKKYCTNCKIVVEILIEGLVGKCPNCNAKLYTNDTRSRDVK